MARIKLGNAEKAMKEDVEWRQVFDWGKKITGVYPNHFRVELNSPLYKWVSKAEETLLAGMGNISSELMNLAAAAICLNNGCAYCTGAWCSVLKVEVRTNDKKIKSLLDHGANSPLLSKKERDVLKFVIKASNEPENLTDAELDRLRGYGLDDSDLLNLVHLVDVVSFSNRVNTIFKTPYDHIWSYFPTKSLEKTFPRMLKDIADRDDIPIPKVTKRKA